MTQRLLLQLLLLSCSLAASGTRVHVIFMNHLDVGYSTPSKVGYVNNVLNLYFQRHFPQALALLRQMRQGGYKERFRYTTQPWLLDLYLDCPNMQLNDIVLQCPNATELADMETAIEAGDIEWHAGPMNMQLENMNGLLLEAALNVSRRLDRRFRPSKTLRVLSQRDVPGMTSAVIPILKRNRVLAVSVGVNAGSYPPEVTREPFLWQDRHSGQSIVAMWHPYGYPNDPGDSPANPGGISVRDCSMVSGVPEILCFSFRSDNQGPPQSVAEVLNTYEILRNQFPGAEIVASTLEDFVTAIMPYQSLMQIVKTEIGDTWIQGIASDPRKMAEYRALSRAFARCTGDGLCSESDSQVQQALRYMIKPPEHTWGLPTQPDQINYANADFKKVKAGPKFVQNENAWSEQRMFNNFSVRSAQGHPLAKYMSDELRQLHPQPPSVDGHRLDLFAPHRVYTCGRYSFSFATDGSIDHLQVNGGVNYASEEERLAKFVYRSYDENDDKKLLNSYGNPGYGKPNITANANPLSRAWPMTVTSFYSRNDNCSFVLQLETQEPMAVSDYGAPQRVFVSFDFGTDVNVEVVLWNKTPTRIEEGLFFEFRVSSAATKVPSRCAWWINKVDGYVDPLRVTYGGTVLQHAVNDHALLLCQDVANGDRQRTLVVQSKDVPLACPFNRFREASPFPYLDRLNSVDGVSFNIYNNVWITNYIFWYPYNEEDANFKARFSLQISH